MFGEEWGTKIEADYVIAGFGKREGLETGAAAEIDGEAARP